MKKYTKLKKDEELNWCGSNFGSIEIARLDMVTDLLVCERKREKAMKKIEFVIGYI